MASDLEISTIKDVTFSSMSKFVAVLEYDLTARTASRLLFYHMSIAKEWNINIEDLVPRINELSKSLVRWILVNEDHVEQINLLTSFLTYVNRSELTVTLKDSLAENLDIETCNRLIKILERILEHGDLDTQLLEKIMIRVIRAARTETLNLATVLKLIDKMNESKHGLFLTILQIVADLALNDESYFYHYLSIVSQIIALNRFSVITWNPKLQTILQKAIVSKDSYVSRNAIFILKAIVFTENCNSEISLDCWKSFFIVHEVLNEKQTHLVTPWLMLIKKLPSDGLPAAWLSTVQHRTLCHDSKTVRLQSLLQILKMDIASDIESSNINMILTALNDAALFRKLYNTKAHDELETAFIFWFNNGSLKSTSFITVVFETIADLMWSPVPLLYVCNYLTRVQCRRVLHLTTIARISALIPRIQRSHNVIIRTKTQIMLVEIVSKFVLEYSHGYVDFLAKFDWEMLNGGTKWYTDKEFTRFCEDFSCIHILEPGTDLLDSQILKQMAICIALREKATEYTHELSGDHNRTKLLIYAFRIRPNLSCDTLTMLALNIREYLMKGEIDFYSDCWTTTQLLFEHRENMVDVCNYYVERINEIPFKSVIVLSKLMPIMKKGSKEKKIIADKMADYALKNGLKIPKDIGRQAAEYVDALMVTLAACLDFDVDSDRLEPPEKLIDESLEWVANGEMANILVFIDRCFSRKKFDDSFMQKVVNTTWLAMDKSAMDYNDCFYNWIRMICRKNVFNTIFLATDYYRNELLRFLLNVDDELYPDFIYLLQYIKTLEADERLLEFVVDIFCTTKEEPKHLRIERFAIKTVKHGGTVGRRSMIDIQLTGCRIIVDYFENDCAFSLVDSLIKRDSFKNLDRYFFNSPIHLKKHRILQLMLIYENYESRSTYQERLFDYAAQSLLYEVHQPSVRYMLEWLLIRIAYHHQNADTLIEKFFDYVDQASDERIGSICSFISVAYHISKLKKAVQCDDVFFEKIVEMILPWTMAQHFNARLYSQTVLKILLSDNRTNFSYDLIRSGIAKGLSRGNAVKNTIKLQDDFYFAGFNPIFHFSFKTIFFDLPRLSNISKDECIPVDKLREYFHGKMIPLGLEAEYTEKDCLSNFEVSSWIVKTTLGSWGKEQSTYREMEVGSTQFEIQKKYIPDVKLADRNVEADNSVELIVVASLLNKPSNLGGLTRTCEIFAVSTLALHNLETTNSKAFKSLSVTAEKHLRIIEVKKYNLFDFLKKIKNDGYCIVGVEQTANSQLLSTVCFSKKSILVFGNEKEGIPANLLALFDTCVEIPQLGVIRSLNVHVSASILIWEFAKQHFIKNV